VKVIEPGIRSLDFAREGFPLLGRPRASMPSHEQEEAKIGLELRDHATDMGLADAESRRSPRHPAMTNDGTKQVDMDEIYHALSAWKRRNGAFDGMDLRGVKSPPGIFKRLTG
jgi:hypothetical protein